MEESIAIASFIILYDEKIDYIQKFNLRILSTCSLQHVGIALFCVGDSVVKYFVDFSNIYRT